MVVSLPQQYHRPADWVLAGTLLASPLWGDLIGHVNTVVSILGGIVGISIGLVRLYKLIKGKDNEE